MSGTAVVQGKSLMSQSKPKFSNRSLALFAGLLVTGSAIAEEVSDELQQIRDSVSSQFESIAPENVHLSPIDGWFTIQKGSLVAYISADGRYLLQGDLIDLETQANLSEASRTDSRRELMSKVTDDQVIKFSPEDVKYTVSIFTDVDCTYCRRLHSQIDEYMAKGIEIRYILYPRNGPASKSWNTAEEVWCSADRNEALTMAKLDREFPTASCDAANISKSYITGQQVGLNGTPAIVLDDGTLIGGYLPAEQLATRLEQNALSR
jgi:thiol:disulfide interchange protein DsbC